MVKNLYNYGLSLENLHGRNTICNTALLSGLTDEEWCFLLLEHSTVDSGSVYALVLCHRYWCELSIAVAMSDNE
jgi:hypothetical protein